MNNYSVEGQRSLANYCGYAGLYEIMLLESALEFAKDNHTHNR